MKKIELKIEGMQCIGCEDIIYGKLKKLPISNVEVDFKRSTVQVYYDEKNITLQDIEEVIKTAGYKVIKGNNLVSVKKTYFNYIIKYIIIILGVNYIMTYIFKINILIKIFDVINDLIVKVPVVTESTSLILLFLIGIMTSFHCVAMCGGINVSQCMTFKGVGKKSPNLLYNLGRVTSYTILGGIVGLVGKAFTLTTNMQGLLYLIISFFMMLMALNIYGLNVFRKILPRLPKKFMNINRNGNTPFVIGLLNGLMPCGPLQTMQIYALSTGSFYKGALSMFLFSIGTVPLMYIFGKLGGVKNQNIAKKFIKISAILVLILAILMLNRGITLLGIGFTNSTENNQLSSIIEEEVQVIYTDLQSRSYPELVLKKGVPVKWVINATESNINGCNNEIIINEYSINKKLEVGTNIIEFTPTEEGVFRYGCWMGMIRATITIID